MNSNTYKRYASLGHFSCIGNRCPDTCCHGWGMQVDARIRALYAKEAPDLLEVIDPEEKVMKRNPETDNCLQLVQGSCALWEKYGTDFLSDSCHFYPRMTRNIAGKTLMALSLSCPEGARLLLLSENPFAIETATLERLPVALVNPVPEGVTQEEAWRLVTACTAFAGEEQREASDVMARFVLLAETLSQCSPSEWGKLVPSFLSRQTPNIGETKPTDPYCLLYALVLLLDSAPTAKRPRLMETIAAMEKALECRIEWETRTLINHSQDFTAYPKCVARFPAERLAPVMKRWIQAQIAMHVFPFYGKPSALFERTALLAFHFALMRLALMCHVKEDGMPPDEETIVRVVQSLSRFLDHLADNAFSLQIFGDLGWLHANRVCGVVR